MNRTLIKLMVPAFMLTCAMHAQSPRTSIMSNIWHNSQTDTVAVTAKETPSMLSNLKVLAVANPVTTTIGTVTVIALLITIAQYFHLFIDLRYWKNEWAKGLGKFISGDNTLIDDLHHYLPLAALDEKTGEAKKNMKKKLKDFMKEKESSKINKELLQEIISESKYGDNKNKAYEAAKAMNLLPPVVAPAA